MIFNKQKGRESSQPTSISTSLTDGEGAFHHDRKEIVVGSKNGNVTFIDQTEVHSTISKLAPTNGYLGAKALPTFSATVGNEYKLLDNQEHRKVNGNIITASSGATIDFSNNGEHPFDVEVLDQATNGLVVQSSKSAGDYVVVDKEELVTNGTFDTDTSGWTNADGYAASVTNGQLSTTRNGGDAFGFYQSVPVEIGVDYVVSAEIISSSVDPRVYIYSDNGTTQLGSLTVLGTSNIKITATTNTLYIYPNGGGSTTATQVTDNISVQLASDVYRNSTNETIPAGTALTDSRFEDRTQYGITNKYLATMRDDGTIKTEVCLVDTAIEHCGNAHKVMTDNGYSKLANGLYSKGSDVVTPIGTWTTKNKGRVSPIFNYFGVYKDTGDKNWYEAGVVAINSTADCFSSVGTAIGSADGKDQKYIYPDQWIDLTVSANAISEQDELNRVGAKAKSGQLDGIGGVVATFGDGYGMNAAFGGSGNKSRIISAFANSSMYPASNPNDNSIKTTIFYTNGTFVEYYNGYQYSGGLRFDTDTVLSASLTVEFLVSTKTLPHPSSGTALRTDVIGNPTNYPQAVKDRLASGLPIIGMNPLLVGQDGTDYATYPITSPILSKKGIVGLSSVNFDGVSVYNTWTAPPLGTANVGNGLNTPYVGLANYTAKIPTTQVTDPKAVKLVSNYVTATNSHSIYKGNQLVPTGKVNVGNGSNGLESRVVENARNGYVTSTDYVTSSGTFEFVTQKTILIDNIGTDGILGGVYKKLSATGTTNWGIYQSFTNTDNYEFIGMFTTTPTHNTIALDNSNSPAYKFIETIAEDEDGMAHYQLFAQEVAYNTTTSSYDGDDGELTQLTNGTLTDDNANTVKTIVASIPLNKYLGD